MWMVDDLERTEKLLPGLLNKLADTPFWTLENADDTEAIDTFRTLGGPALLIPIELGGRGATARDAVSVQRTIGASAPSLAVASTMHHFSLSTLMVMASEGGAQEAMLLEAIATQSLLVASGFAEGRPGGNILRPSMQSARVEGGYRISGSKKPCSLSRSMDLLTASVAVEGNDGQMLLGVALIAASDPALTRTPFWEAPALVAAESHRVDIDDVFVADSMVVVSDAAAADGLDRLQTAGLVWFETLMTACYVGIVSRLCSSTLVSDRPDDGVSVRTACAVESAMASVYSIADEIDNGNLDKRTLARVLMCRYAIQDVLNDAVSMATESLGGTNFVTNPEAAYVAESARCLAFHPPARGRMSPRLKDYLRGEEFTVA